MPIEASRVAVAIIAGGGATRFGGTVKALIEVDGVTILDRQLAVLRPLFPTILISANDPEPYAHTGLVVVPDAVAGRGPLAGFAAALSHVREEVLFALACDMPFIQSDIIELLLGRMNDGVDAVAPFIDGWPEPLHALYSRRCVPVIEHRLAHKKNKVSGLLTDEKLRVDKVTEGDLRGFDPELRAFTNINSPADLP